MIHEHSIDAYRTELPRLSRRGAAVLSYVRENGRSTDREVMRGMGFTDPNAVRPRITELIESGLLAEVGEKTCPVTRKTVRVVDIPKPQQKELFS